jgi:hypothetical protein
MTKKLTSFLAIVIALGSISFNEKAAAAKFSDVTDAEDPYFEAISYVEAEGIVQGYPDGTYKPKKVINRAEFTKIIIEATVPAQEITGESCFPDVNTEWFAPYVCTASRMGIVQGYPDGEFKPAENINFVEAAKIIAEAFEASADSTKEPWYQDYVNFLSSNNAIPEEISTLDLKITRGQMAEIAYRIHGEVDYKYSRYLDLVNNELAMKESIALGDSYFAYDDYVFVEIYNTEYLISEADLGSFEVLGNDFAKDANNVYYLGMVFDFDAPSFEYLGNYYVQDQGGVYRIIDDEEGFIQGSLLDSADAASFETLNWAFAKDKNQVYLADTVIESADPLTFEALGSFYGKDAQNAYAMDQVLSGVDLDTFRSQYLSEFARDQSQLIFRGEKVSTLEPAAYDFSRPNVELFVMSHCPYGLQMEKALLPVVEALGSEIDFDLQFNTYAMHGEVEVNEQMRQHCIQKEQNDQLIDYLSCFTQSGNSSSCLSSAGINQNLLTSCVGQLDNKYAITASLNDQTTWQNNFPPFPVDRPENELYGVEGSPTLVVNGYVIERAPRNANDLLELICGFFENPPASCSQDLLSTTPQAGFDSSFSN